MVHRLPDPFTVKEASFIGPELKAAVAVDKKSLKETWPRVSCAPSHQRNVYHTRGVRDPPNVPVQIAHLTSLILSWVLLEKDLISRCLKGSNTYCFR